MDAALILKERLIQEPELSFDEAQRFLQSSKIFDLLLQDFEPLTLNLLWRLTQLAEIPFAYKFQQVSNWLNQLKENTFTGNGFSLKGTNDYLLPCYNGMITSLLIRLKSSSHSKIEKGIEWIIKYQNFERNKLCKWEGSGVKKYGGCFKATPCYIGIIKSTIALSDYKININHTDIAVNSKLDKGLDYILNQQVFLRLSDNKPITKDITKLTYPFTYKINIVEILSLLQSNALLNDYRCYKALELLKNKVRKDGFWYQNYSTFLKNKIWVPFDTIKEPGYWLSFVVNKLISE